MSATAWRPVRRTRSSAGPHATLTLQPETQMTSQSRLVITTSIVFNSLRPRQNGRHFADDTFGRIFLNENLWTLLKHSLKIVPKVRINNIPALVQIMAWCRTGDKSLSAPMMVSLPTHICVTRPQWVKWFTVNTQQRHMGCFSWIWNEIYLPYFSLPWFMQYCVNSTPLYT